MNITSVKYHQHDCEQCVYLGSAQLPRAFHGNEGSYDFYMCGEGWGNTDPTLIARDGSEGSSYYGCPLSLIDVKRSCMEGVVAKGLYYIHRATLNQIHKV
jgi:hypothetical protein